MGLRDNFKQAARELLPGAPGGEGIQPSAEETRVESSFSLDELADLGRPMSAGRTEAAPAAAVAPPVVNYAPAAPTRTPVADPFTPAAFTTAPAYAPAPTPAYATAPSAPVAPAYQEEFFQKPIQRTLIAANTTIQGSIQGADGVDIFGEWIGDIEIKDDLKLNGRLDGNATGREADLHRGRVRGDLVMIGHVVVDRESMVLGNIKAGSMLLGGKVKGNIEVRGSLTLEANAVVLGNVTAANLTIAEGAVIQGKVQILSKDVDKLFQEFTQAPARPTAPTPRASRAAAKVEEEKAD